MKLNYEVKRNRASVTQGNAEIYLNDEMVISFADKIEIGGKYGENIGGWGSVKSDDVFIKGVLFPFFANQEVIEKRVTEILNLK
ncbi:MAG: hypothetical protein KBT36_08840 [Kurthia sp.]|nr:hypothetical protein [Candidatus Kurthia equi]